jgi:cytochrome c553
MNFIRHGLFLACLSAAVPSAAEPRDGAALAFKYHCVTCHGAAGKSSESRYPHLAGQHALYLEARLKYFRDGIESSNQMNGQAAPLTDEEIAVLADYFAGLPR